MGSSLDSQIWYEPYQARELRLFMKSDLLSSFLISCLFLLLMKPVLDSSKLFSMHLHPVISVRNGEYFVVFSWCLVSMFLVSGIVSLFICSVLV